MIRREFPLAPIVGVGGVVIHRGKVLLVKRGSPPLQGEWSLPGGALELGETLQQGVAREVLEETGLIVTPLEIVEVLDKITKDPESGKTQYHYVLIDFLCEVTGGELGHASDADEARWAAREELNSYGSYRLQPYTVIVIEKAFRLSQTRKV